MTPVDPFTIYLTAAGAIVLGIIIISLISRFASGSDNKQRNDGQLAQASPQAADCPPHGPGGIRRGGARRRMRVHHNVSDEENSDEDIVSQVQQSEGKLGAKKLQKLQKKAERKAVREEMERERQDRKQREQEAEEKQKKMEEQEKREQTLKEEEERKAHEEKERREHDEYLKLKEAFSVDAEGQDEAEADLNSESLLQEFIKYIKDTKVVMLEELAAHFKLRTQDVIQRVQDLQACGNLTGVIDDRGKFIYITTQELEAVAKYVKQHGRVSKADLAASSNRLITLDCQLQFVTKETS